MVKVDNVEYQKVAERGKPGTPTHVAVLTPKDRGRRRFLKTVLLMPMVLLECARGRACCD